MVRAPQQSVDLSSLRTLLGTSDPPPRAARQVQESPEASCAPPAAADDATSHTRLPRPRPALSSLDDVDSSDSDTEPGPAPSHQADAAASSSAAASVRSSGCPPAYNARTRFRPERAEDHGDGGAFPEIHVLQYPLDMAHGLPGPGGAPVDLNLDYEKLQRMASQAALRADETSVEYESFRRFMRAHHQDVLAAFPSASSVPRVTGFDPAEVEQRCLQGVGLPLIFSDGMQDWEARRKWTLDHLRKCYGGDTVTANDRAPARRVDGLTDRAQRSVTLPLGDFIRYMQERAKEPELPGQVPFYLNGWRAYISHLELQKEAPLPYFTEHVDQTREILAQVDQTLFKGGLDRTATGGKPWWDGIDTNLSKLFMGPAGTITRLHFDSGDAHAWLGQVTGRKLFVCFSPEDTQYLYQMESEVETSQSPIDVLAPDHEKYPEYSKAQPYVFVLHPGEVVLVPKGWWHYAVSLDTSITAMRNWYHAPSNGQDFVKFVVKSIQKTKIQLRDDAAALKATREGSSAKPR